jgi:ubiquinone/menaquinone biosynthesis C-methylase UbiE
MNYPWDTAMVQIRRSTWMRTRRLRMFGIKKTDRILDLGCGDGLDIQILFEHGYKHIIGVDISPKLLVAAKIRNPGIRFVLASAEKLPFKDETFDVILADSMLYHIVCNRKALREIRRVLSRGGRLCFVDMHVSPMRAFFDALTFSPLGRVMPYLRKRQRAYRAEQKAIERWRGKELDFFRKLEHEGFQKVYTRIDGLSIMGQYQRI